MVDWVVPKIEFRRLSLKMTAAGVLLKVMEFLHLILH